MRSIEAGGILLIGIKPDNFVASRDVTGIEIFTEPSKLVAVPVTPSVKDIVLAVDNFVEVAALPVHEPDEPETLVCAGWIWLPLANLESSVPTAAVPATIGVVELAIA